VVLKEGAREERQKKRKRKEGGEAKEEKEPKTKKFSSSDWWEKRAVRFHSDWSEKIRATNQVFSFSFSFSFMPKTPSMTSSQSLHSLFRVVSENESSLFAS